MSAQEPKTYIVRPFGMMSGDYEVDATGLFTYRLASIVAVGVLGLLAARKWIEIPGWLVVGGVIAGLIITATLCGVVVSKGRKL